MSDYISSTAYRHSLLCYRDRKISLEKVQIRQPELSKDAMNFISSYKTSKLKKLEWIYLIPWTDDNYVEV